MPMAIKRHIQDSFDSELEDALVKGAKSVKDILNDDDAPNKDVIAAFNAVVSASGLRGQRQADQKPDQVGLQSLNSQTLEALQTAFSGLARLAGLSIDPTVLKSAAENAMIADTVEPGMISAPDMSVTVDLPTPRIVVTQEPEYINGLTTPRSIEIKRLKAELER